MLFKSNTTQQLLLSVNDSEGFKEVLDAFHEILNSGNKFPERESPLQLVEDCL